MLVLFSDQECPIIKVIKTFLTSCLNGSVNLNFNSLENNKNYYIIIPRIWSNMEQLLSGIQQNIF